MLLENKCSLKLNQQARFMDGIMLIDNEQPVILPTTIDYAIFQHYDAKNNLLKEYRYETQILGFKSLDKDEAIFLLTELNQIGIINFRTQEQRTIPFNFRNKSIYRSKLFVFPESKSYCIFENPEYSQKSGKFTFFSYSDSTKPIWEEELEDVFTFNVKPINDYSQMGVYKGRMETNMEFTILDFLKKTNRKVVASRPGGGDYVIKTINELTPGNYFLFCDTTLPENRNLVFTIGDIACTTRPFKTNLP
jgi:hypothetical protein